MTLTNLFAAFTFLLPFDKLKFGVKIVWELQFI